MKAPYDEHTDKSFEGLEPKENVQPDSPMSGNLEGVGTEESGYAGPEYGPFKCGNCRSFDGEGCTHPEVKADDEVEKLDDGRGAVDPEGCCNFYRNKEGENGAGTEMQKV